MKGRQEERKKERERKNGGEKEEWGNASGKSARSTMCQNPKLSSSSDLRRHAELRFREKL